ncbi:PREDICTED: probable LRR receptor-like serine/threonine-protein kinase At3g47570 [Erythranthe guttata]|uniref:probable LRR receptor-like serine/threonine-protein kinase At3g47570 n=1 Tax=Erythranthe guttata TaxID=4155 RepID=UPI00064E03A7|nr:PREDICTED: probable LRR receptor-like serine/threonine-protein kinase At3g47570 [Erythranthe guttata]|eukprot:XP_012845860.1 PREDICTED: probable LRR receptor-like serine/threonine-protein kinase At3g47570 [Erythranthe guttata]
MEGCNGWKKKQKVVSVLFTGFKTALGDRLFRLPQNLVVKFTTLLKGLFANGKVVDAEKLFKKALILKLCEPNEVMIMTVINGLCKNGHVHVARDLLWLLEKTIYKPNVKANTATGKVDEACRLFLEASSNGSYEANDLLVKMESCSECAPDSMAYNNIIHGLLKRKEVYEARPFLEEMYKSRFSANAATSSMSRGFEGEIPQSLSQLEGLSYINLGDNNLIGTIPLGMFNISTIEQFKVDFNDIHGTIPSTIGLTLPNLKLLVLGKNQFSGRVPISLSNVSSLELLVLSVNNFNGIMPRFGGLSKLDSLYAAETLIEDDISFISSLTNCTSLRVLDLGDNPLITGSIPETIANMSTLFDRLRIYGTQIVGRIPAGIGNLIRLTRLQLSYNNIEGPIPLSIGRLFNLRVLNLEDNRITSDAPSAFGNLTFLYSLSLQINNFSGIIPTSLVNCTTMRELDLSRNNFIGPIPREILIPTSYVFWNLSYNELTGSIPVEVGSLTKVEVLDFSNNRLSGLVPNSLGMCNSLEWLHLEGNLFEGQIPQGLGSLRGLTNLDLSRNNLSRTIPIFLNLLHATNGFSEYNILGRGRFGSVYKGIIDNGHTFLAVKILNLFVKGATKSFMAECNALSGIRHKNVVKMLSVCESVDFQGNDFKALIYEFKANGSLDKWLCYNREQEKGQSETQLRYLDIKQRLNIAIDIARAVEYLHCGTNSTIVHGDLKPSNILLDQDMTACVGDFGLAKIISSILSPQESSGTIGIRGTIGYVPPEYGTSNTITRKGDVYSYGILVLEMFTNRRQKTNR